MRGSLCDRCTAARERKGSAGACAWRILVRIQGHSEFNPLISSRRDKMLAVNVSENHRCIEVCICHGAILTFLQCVLHVYELTFMLRGGENGGEKVVKPVTTVQD